MSTEANDLLRDATPEQVRWVIERLFATSDGAAAKKAGVHPSTVSRWLNKAQLDEAVNALLLDTVGAAVTILEMAAPQAAQGLVASLNDKRSRVAAANSILDRVGVTEKRQVDVTSAGQPIRIKEIVVERTASDDEGSDE